MKKQIVIAAAVTLILSALLLGWHVSQPIRIGAVLPIDTSLGNEENLFIRYYQDRHPRIGLRPVQFLIENPPSTEEAVRAAYQRLERQGVAAIIGGVLSKDGVWLAEEAARSNVPTFGLTSSSAVLSGKQDAFYRLCSTNASQAKAVGMYFQSIGVQRLVVVTSVDNVAYVDPYIASIAEDFRGEMLQIPFYPDATTYTRIFAAEPDGIFTILAAKDVIQVIQAVREQDAAIPIGSSSWASVEILSLYSSPILDGVLFFSLGIDLYGEAYQVALADFETRYSMKATNGSHYALSVSRVLYEAIEAVGASREALTAYFETPRIYDTVYGPIAMDEYGDANSNRVTVLEIMDGAMNKKEVVVLK
jgi:ABC-type branched-subunit amino acid transport system substrate-binding protein